MFAGGVYLYFGHLRIGGGVKFLAICVDVIRSRMALHDAMDQILLVDQHDSLW